MKLDQALRDKKFWVVGGLGAALGLGVWYQRKKSGQSAQSTPNPSGTTPVGVGYTGGFDSTGTDVASWLGNFSGSLQNQLDQFNNQLTGALAGTAAITSKDNGAVPNDQWGTQAFNWLAKYNQWKTIDPTMAQLAINDYIGGKADVPPWEKWTINEILSGNRGSVHEGPGLAPPANLPPGWVR